MCTIKRLAASTHTLSVSRTHSPSLQLTIEAGALSLTLTDSLSLSAAQTSSLPPPHTRRRNGLKREQSSSFLVEIPSWVDKRRARSNLFSVLVLNSSNTYTMREIVHLQAGQCGNQIGAKVRMFYSRRLWFLICRLKFASPKPCLIEFVPFVSHF